MKKLIPILLVAITFTISVKAQYIYEVLEYVPAPGQLININPWGTPTSAFSILNSINGHLSLGAFGGYVVFKFENPVVNDPDNPFGVDFTVFGNAITGRPEPGIVEVMEDENENGLPDDIWYELAGSDYYFSSTKPNYEVTYQNPGDTMAEDVYWFDNEGQEGYVFANSFYKQPYYPNSDSFLLVGPVQYALAGTSIPSIVDSTNPGYIQLPQRAFGYADNHVKGSSPWTMPDNPYTYEKENSGGDAFDISWAVDSQGNIIHLNKIDFVKVHTAVLGHTGWLGEISTEICGAVDVTPDISVSGIVDMIVINPTEIPVKTDEIKMEALRFHKGKPVYEETFLWSVNEPNATISNDGVLSVSESGEYEVTVKMQTNEQITASLVVKVDLSSSAIYQNSSDNLFNIIPNPVNTHFQIKRLEGAHLIMYNIRGEKIKEVFDYSYPELIDVSGLETGLYMLYVDMDNTLLNIKLVKR